VPAPSFPRETGRQQNPVLWHTRLAPAAKGDMDECRHRRTCWTCWGSWDSWGAPKQRLLLSATTLSP